MPVYGMDIILNKHPVYQAGTIYLEDGKGLIVTQQHFYQDMKSCWWGAVDPDIANSIYLSPNFRDFFMKNARADDPPIFQLRKLMWKLRMKPLKREEWEDYF